MSVAKKIGPTLDDKINANIQRKFDLVFVDKSSIKPPFPNENSDNVLKNPQNFDVDEMIMERNDGKNKNDSSATKLDFDLTSTGKTSPTYSALSKPNSATKGKVELDFSLDFDVNLEKSDTATVTRMSVNQAPHVTSDDKDVGGFTLDDSDIGDVDYKEDATQKTLVFNTAVLEKSSLNNHTSIDMMSNAEAKANIESTIKDILGPDLKNEMDFDSSKDSTDISQIEDSILDLGHTPSGGFILSEIVDDKEAFSLDLSNSKNNSEETRHDSTMDFDLSELKVSTISKGNSEIEEEELDAPTRIAELNFNKISMPTPTKLVEVQIKAGASVETLKSQNVTDESLSDPTNGVYATGLKTEDSMRFHATIRALREEREEMLLQIKNLKRDSKELEQDNLTLKANLDEAKIEITILRKRHMLEIEDLKYRASLSEEKKAMADEKAKIADMRREKLEQKVRIDFNQVKQREKELESKLELLSMDVDSQVQSRDQKILELRRKIDALEFNMENASIKEQRSHDDKRKLEDRLNKIMKTLRHSIKNLEDDIDHMDDEGDLQKDKN